MGITETERPRRRCDRLALRLGLATCIWASCAWAGCGGGSGPGVGDRDAGTGAHDAEVVLDAGDGADASVGRDAGTDAGTDAGPPDAGPPPREAPYPIVLAHGFFGFEDFAGAGFLSYFYGVRDHLGARGELEVYTPAVDPFNSSEARGEELLAEVIRITEELHVSKVNLIGHSQGGLDARYVAHMRPDLVASVTTIATPHYGSLVADILLRIVADDRFRDLADELVRVVGAPLWDAAGMETSLFLSLEQLSAPGMEEFNRLYPDAPGVDYYSIGGRSDREVALDLCYVDGSPAFLAGFARETDPIDPLLSFTESILDGGLFENIPNDGLVTVESSRWGRFLGCVPADHLDQIGQLLGDSPGLFNDWSYLSFYADLVAWLRDQGY